MIKATPSIRSTTVPVTYPLPYMVNALKSKIYRYPCTNPIIESTMPMMIKTYFIFPQLKKSQGSVTHNPDRHNLHNRVTL